MRMCRPNFRVKLDLCKFYNDARRFCWVFVDGTKMLQIAHVKEHITKLFDIQEPFHLLLNEVEYLPPKEDVRILKENETIVVTHGSGLDNVIELPVSTTELPHNKKQYVNGTIVNNVCQHKESQTNLRTVQPNKDAIKENVTDQNKSTAQSDASEVSTVLQVSEDNDDENTAGSKNTSTSSLHASDTFSISENYMPRSKRRRVRHRRKKAQKMEQASAAEEGKKPKKPKIITSCVVSAGKHIRFDNIDIEEPAAKQSPQEGTANGFHANKVSPSEELSTLLSMRNSATPLTFTNTRLKTELKIEQVSEEEMDQDTFPENVNENTAIIRKLKEGKELSNDDLETCLVMTTKPELKHVIAFKMLKIGADYTPQVSAFIVAEVISYCENNSLYTFKVLQGVSEVQVPVGKFTVMEDEEEHTMNDTITLNYAQMIEPRFVSNFNPTRASTPFRWDI